MEFCAQQKTISSDIAFSSRKLLEVPLSLYFSMRGGSQMLVSTKD
jgi:hypothetical protein